MSVGAFCPRDIKLDPSAFGGIRCYPHSSPCQWVVPPDMDRQWKHLQNTLLSRPLLQIADVWFTCLRTDKISLNTAFDLKFSDFELKPFVFQVVYCVLKQYSV